MDLKSIFNILLLSLSLATVLITLISFILYKLRQLSVKGQFKDPVRMEGVFFVRYAPHLEKINKEAREKVTQIHAKKGFSVSLGALFAIVVGVIATSLFAETYLVELQERRNKIAVVDNYRKLVDQGLLKRYDYSPKPSTEKLVAWKNTSQDGDLSSLKDKLKSTQIYLATSRNKNTEDLLAFKKWESFFLSRHIQFKKGQLLATPKSSLLVLPSPRVMTRSEKNFIEAHLAKGSGVLLTGPVAILNGLNEKTNGDWTEQIMGLKFSECPDRQAFPTLFAVDQAPWWSLPPGALNEWLPQSTSSCAFIMKESNNIAAFEANYDGHIRYLDQENQKPIVRGLFKNVSGGRIAWIAFDPEMVSETSTHQSLLQDQVIFSSLSWTAHQPSAKVAAWPNGKKMAVAFGASFNKDNEFLPEYLRSFQKNKVPLTLFVSPSSIGFLRDTLKDVPLENLDLAVDVKATVSSQGSKNHVISRFDFDEIEKTRLDIEEQSARIVQGIRISRQSFSSSVLFSALINRLSFALIDDYQRGLEVINFEGRPFVWIPKYSPLNQEIGVNRLPASSVYSRESIKYILKNDLNLGRLVTLFSDNLTSDSMGVLNSALDELKEASWASFNFDQLQKWVLNQGNLRVTLQSKLQNSYILVVANQNKTAVDNISVHLDLSPHNHFRVSSVRMPAGKQDEQLTLTDNRLLHIGHMEPNSEIRIEIEPNIEGEK